MSALFILLLFISCSQDKYEENLRADLLQRSERRNPTQYFQISPQSDTLITCRRGTKLFVSPHSFVLPNGDSVSTEITLSVKEVNQFSEMILNGLTTTSDGHLLRTSGMVNVGASIGSQELILRERASLRLQFPKMTIAPYMRTYHTSESEEVNWQLDQENRLDTAIFRTYSTLGDSTGGDTTVSMSTWGIVGNDTLLLRQATNSDSNDFYKLHSTKLDWINCDFFTWYDDLIDLQVVQKESIESQNYLIFPELSSVSKASLDPLVHLNMVPRNYEVTIVSIARSKGAYKLAVHEILTQKDEEKVHLNYKSVSMEEMESQLRTLDLYLFQ